MTRSEVETSTMKVTLEMLGDPDEHPDIFEVGETLFGAVVALGFSSETVSKIMRVGS